MYGALRGRSFEGEGFGSMEKLHSPSWSKPPAQAVGPMSLPDETRKTYERKKFRGSFEAVAPSNGTQNVAQHGCWSRPRDESKRRAKDPTSGARSGALRAARRSCKTVKRHYLDRLSAWGNAGACRNRSLC
jgi:hypothetical protein